MGLRPAPSTRQTPRRRYPGTGSRRTRTHRSQGPRVPRFSSRVPPGAERQGREREARQREKQGGPDTKQKERGIQPTQPNDVVTQQDKEKNDCHTSTGAASKRNKTGTRRKRYPEPNSLHGLP